MKKKARTVNHHELNPISNIHVTERWAYDHGRGIIPALVEAPSVFLNMDLELRIEILDVLQSHSFSRLSKLEQKLQRLNNLSIRDLGSWTLRTVLSEHGNSKTQMVSLGFLNRLIATHGATVDDTVIHHALFMAAECYEFWVGKMKRLMQSYQHVNETTLLYACCDIRFDARRLKWLLRRVQEHFRAHADIIFRALLAPPIGTKLTDWTEDANHPDLYLYADHGRPQHLQEKGARLDRLELLLDLVHECPIPAAWREPTSIRWPVLARLIDVRAERTIQLIDSKWPLSMDVHRQLRERVISHDDVDMCINICRITKHAFTPADVSCACFHGANRVLKHFLGFDMPEAAVLKTVQRPRLYTAPPMEAFRYALDLVDWVLCV
jgi:hypothetical protein